MKNNTRDSQEHEKTEDEVDETEAYDLDILSP